MSYSLYLLPLWSYLGVDICVIGLNGIHGIHLHGFKGYDFSKNKKPFQSFKRHDFSKDFNYEKSHIDSSVNQTIHWSPSVKAWDMKGQCQ